MLFLENFLEVIYINETSIESATVHEFCGKGKDVSFWVSLDGFMRKDSLIATSASRFEEKRTTPASPRISANFTSPTSRNLSRKFCQVQEAGSYM